MHPLHAAPSLFSNLAPLFVLCAMIVHLEIKVLLQWVGHVCLSGGLYYCEISRPSLNLAR